MSESQITLTFVISLITILTAIGKLIFDYATLKSTMASNFANILNALTRIEATLSAQDGRIKDIEKRVIHVEANCTRHAKEA